MGEKPHPHDQSPFCSTLLSRNKKIKKKSIKNSCLTPSLTSIFSLAHALLFRSSLAFTRSEFWQPPLHLLSRTHISFSILTYCRSLRYIYGYSIFLSSNLFRSFVSGSFPPSLSLSARARAQRTISSLWIVSLLCTCLQIISAILHIHTHTYMHIHTHSLFLSFAITF